MRRLRADIIFVVLALALLDLPKVKSDLLNLGDAASSLKDLTVGLAKDIANILPNPMDIFHSSKNALAAYPLEAITTAVNTICSSALSTNTIKPRITPDLSRMQFQLRTSCNKYNYPFLNATAILESPEFDAEKKVVILATGWRTTIEDSSPADALSKAFNCRGDVNFVVIDVETFVDTLYTWSALNTEYIGESLAKGLELLTEVVPVENIHLIGHSLGAHIVGAAARHFNYNTDKFLPHITGLDPAKPCFNEGFVLSGLLRGDAKFIDVIHSNPGVLGKRDPLGDLDFYPGGLDPLPTGCFTPMCAHARAWEYYAETLYSGNHLNFMSRRCTSLTSLKQNKCPGEDIPMGYAVPHDRKGNFFLDVNGEAPFGKQSVGKRVISKTCGLCPTDG